MRMLLKLSCPVVLSATLPRKVQIERRERDFREIEDLKEELKKEQLELTEGGRREDEIKPQADRQNNEYTDNMNEMDRLRQEAWALADSWRQERTG